MNILLIGAGQLGSRHLQSLLKFEQALTIYVVDKSPESLNVAEQRAQEVETYETHEVRYLDSLDNVPTQEIWLLVVATGANIRRMVFEQALNKFDVKNAILEKFLFQSEADFECVSKLVESKNVNVFVNCPLRAYPFFEDVKSCLQEESKPVTIEYEGGEWIGLGCNSIHYIDLMNYFTGETVSEVRVDELDDEIIDSKRQGFVEFTGKIKISFNSESQLILSSVKNSQQDSKITIASGTVKYVIDELTGNYELFVNNQLTEKSQYTVIYQSNLTHKMLEQIQQSGTCQLVAYKISQQLHLAFLSELLSFYNLKTSKNTDSLPIT